jgi:ABC-type transport system involved in cytochrome c biogenesis ATPase subunit
MAPTSSRYAESLLASFYSLDMQRGKDDLTAWENMVVSATLSGTNISRVNACQALDKPGLARAASLPTTALSQSQGKRVAPAPLSLNTAKVCTTYFAI